jgi:hypothetical protein
VTFLGTACIHIFLAIGFYCCTKTTESIHHLNSNCRFNITIALVTSPSQDETQISPDVSDISFSRRGPPRHNSICTAAIRRPHETASVNPRATCPCVSPNRVHSPPDQLRCDIHYYQISIGKDCPHCCPLLKHRPTTTTPTLSRLFVFRPLQPTCLFEQTHPTSQVHTKIYLATSKGLRKAATETST